MDTYTGPTSNAAPGSPIPNPASKAAVRAELFRQAAVTQQGEGWEAQVNALLAIEARLEQLVHVLSSR